VWIGAVKNKKTAEDAAKADVAPVGMVPVEEKSGDGDSKYGGGDEEEEDKENSDGVGGKDQVAHVSSVDAASGQVIMVAKGVGLRQFQLDHAFPGGTPQADVYAEAASHLVMDFMNGYNATIIVYGQTGSGKTHTMFHPPAEDQAPPLVVGAGTGGGGGHKGGHKQGERLPAHVKRSSTFASVEKGVVPRACEEVLEAVRERERDHGIRCTLSVSYVEIYGNDVSDLLQGGQRVGQSKVAAQRYVMDGEVQVPVETLYDIEDALRRGDSQKRRAATAMNERSSRAHSLFILSLEMENPHTRVRTSSRLFLADLGGSEQVKKSQVQGGHTTAHGGFQIGDRMREAIYINQGLLSLKQCIEALNRGDSYVPYQDSKLTMLLSPALGGNSKTSVITCASMARSNAAETLQTLRFAEKCSRVQNEASQKLSGVAAIIDAIDEEMAQIEELIRGKERWEQTEQVRADTSAEALDAAQARADRFTKEGDTGDEGKQDAEVGTQGAAKAGPKGGANVEIVTVGRVVGAEAERERLETLIRRRARLTGGDVDMRLAEAGFGGPFGGAADKLGGHAQIRFAEKAGLLMKGKLVAEWQA
jgi:kinesin family protein 5